MITKEEFAKFIDNYKEFSEGIERFEKAITGSEFTCNLLETDWGDAVGKMLDSFLDSHFTEEGVDYICYWLWEDEEDKKVIIDTEDMFGITETEYPLNSLDELWNYLLTNPKLYFKNYE